VVEYPRVFIRVGFFLLRMRGFEVNTGESMKTATTIKTLELKARQQCLLATPTDLAPEASRNAHDQRTCRSESTA
jgi:hypothetical protein